MSFCTGIYKITIENMITMSDYIKTKTIIVLTPAT